MKTLTSIAPISGRLSSLVAVAFVLAVAALTLFGCGSREKTDGSNPTGGKLHVVATTGMIGDAVHTIAGDKITLYTMMGPGVDPHLYKATREDIDQLDRADVVFYNGLHLEAKLGEILEKMSTSRTVVAVGEAVPMDRRRMPQGASGQPDPHIWFDFSLWARVVDTIGHTLAQVDPANAEFYLANTAAYHDSLTAEHARITREMAEIPKDRRVMITAHDAFHYFGIAYDVEVRGLQGISTVAEAGLHDVTQLVDMLVARKIKAVFVESSVSPKAIEAVVEGCRARGHNVVIGGQLYSDALGQAGTPDATLLGAMRHNVNTIVTALK